MRNGLLILMTLALATACSKDEPSSKGGDNAASKEGSVKQKAEPKTAGDKSNSAPWTGSINGAAVEGKTATVNVQGDKTMFSFQAKAEGKTIWIEMLVDDADHSSTGTFTPVTVTVIGGASSCGYQRNDESTLKLTIDHIAQSKPHRPPSSSKGNFEGKVKCKEGDAISLLGSWDY